MVTTGISLHSSRRVSTVPLGPDEVWAVVAGAGPGLEDRRVEITGPTDRKMVINALNSGALTFMSDLEDANCPKWDNVIQGQINLFEAIRRLGARLAGRPVLGFGDVKLLAAIGAAVTVGLRRGGLLVSILVLPLYVPVLIFGLSASQANAAPGLTTASLLILAAIALVSLVVSPLASAAALRSYLK